MVKSAFVVPAFPSVCETSLMTMEGRGSLSVMVPVPMAVAIVAFTGFERVTRYVSLASFSTSPCTAIGTVCVVTPGENVSVPDAAV